MFDSSHFYDTEVTALNNALLDIRKEPWQIFKEQFSNKSPILTFTGTQEEKTQTHLTAFSRKMQTCHT